MATQASIVDHIASQVCGAGNVRYRKMFGEYALYCDDKVVALICDDRLYVKPTEAGRAHMERFEEAPPYPGSKPYLVVEEDRWDDREWLTELIRCTARELPAPKDSKSSGRK